MRSCVFAQEISLAHIFYEDFSANHPWYRRVAAHSLRSRIARHLSKTGTESQATCLTEGLSRLGESSMPDVTVVYWRDIPAQVIVGKGRRGAKKQLAERFEQAIDRAAMKTGAAETDDYLAEWRKADPYAVEGDPTAVAEAEAARLEAEYDTDKIKALIANGGWANA